MSSAHPVDGRSVLLELTRHECLELLSSHHVGRLAVNSNGLAPIVRPVNYVFDHHAQAVIFRTAQGSKLHSLLHETHAAFEVDELNTATRTGWSVIIVGVTEPLTKPNEIRRAEGLGLDSWAAGGATDLIRVRAWTVSGRRLKDPSAVG